MTTTPAPIANALAQYPLPADAQDFITPYVSDMLLDAIDPDIDHEHLFEQCRIHLSKYVDAAYSAQWMFYRSNGDGTTWPWYTVALATINYARVYADVGWYKVCRSPAETWLAEARADLALALNGTTTTDKE